jgi:serine/threonine protein kinase
MESSQIIKLPFSVNKKFKEIELDDDVINNFITINNTDYLIGPINPNFKHSKGAHSFVFGLFDAQSYQDEDEDEHIPINTIKISNVYDVIIKEKIRQHPRNIPFFSEIEALKHCSKNKTNHVVDISYDGYLTFEQYAYPFYIMEYADTDLKEYMEANREDMSYEDKVNLCAQLAKGLEELNSLGYYHRDLKPDNIFMFGDDWKIGDLGMVATRYKDNYDGEKTIIGPKGWLSPEPMNKYLTHNSNPQIDCSIDHQSDIFQLGKIFWYIMQGNVPIGVIHNADYINGKKAMFKIIMHMITYNKQKRSHDMKKDVIDKLENIISRF